MLLCGEGMFGKILFPNNAKNKVQTMSRTAPIGKNSNILIGSIPLSNKKLLPAMLVEVPIKVHVPPSNEAKAIGIK